MGSPGPSSKMRAEINLVSLLILSTAATNETLFKIQFPIGFGGEELLETDPAIRNVYLNTTYSNNNIALAFGSLGVVAVLAPALYIGYLASSTGQIPLAISRRYFHSILRGTDYSQDVGNLDLTGQTTAGSLLCCPSYTPLIRDI